MKKFYKYSLFLFFYIAFFSCSESNGDKTNFDCNIDPCLHGSCVNKICECENGYAGEQCTVCDSGFYMNKENFCTPKTEGMSFIPSGKFTKGCISDKQSCSIDDSEYEEIFVSNFEIDKYEITVSEFKSCVDSGNCSEPIFSTVDTDCNYNNSNRLNHPINCVNYKQAEDYCKWVGKRLPTSNEWEKSARGTELTVYPWGDNGLNCNFANIFDTDKGCGSKATSSVGSKELGASIYQVYDLIGNVWEWTSTSKEQYKIVKGGAWNIHLKKMFTISYNGTSLESISSPSLGFRCAK
ncbi:SUMF1/EgtB/PvdO family nonheme iron enzyme [bacterium]|nr:SUMF1/EgtB/PvdO family nonheme iron enzyme [bacterium]